MQLFPGNGGGSDLGKALTLAAIGAGAYYGLGGLAGAGEAAFLPASQTAMAQGIGGAGTAAALDIAAGGAASGIGASLFQGAKAAAPTVGTVLAAGALTPKIPGMPEFPIRPPPTRRGSEISAAAEKQRQIELARRGRRASILTSSRGIEDELGVVNRPRATEDRQATLLGG